MAVLTTAATDEPVLPDTSQWIYLPTTKDIVACIDAVQPPRASVARVGGNITAPRKTRNVDPTYPVSMQKSGVQGVVVLNSVISDTGCVKGARVVRSVHPTIDLAAMNAVAQWRFSPTRLDGQGGSSDHDRDRELHPAMRARGPAG